MEKSPTRCFTLQIAISCLMALWFHSFPLLFFFSFFLFSFFLFSFLLLKFCIIHFSFIISHCVLAGKKQISVLFGFVQYFISERQRCAITIYMIFSGLLFTATIPLLLFFAFEKTCTYLLVFLFFCGLVLSISRLSRFLGTNINYLYNMCGANVMCIWTCNVLSWAIRRSR